MPDSINVTVTLKAKKKHYVVFASPGTMFSEQTKQPIKSLSPKTAVKMAKKVVERHGATPFGFHFSTENEYTPVKDDTGATVSIPNRKVVESGFYWLGGKIKKYDDIPETPETSILRSNMRCNDWWLVVENTNSYRTTSQFEENHKLLNKQGVVVAKGNDPKFVAYRKKCEERKKAERLNDGHPNVRQGLSRTVSEAPQRAPSLPGLANSAQRRRALSGS